MYIPKLKRTINWKNGEVEKLYLLKRVDNIYNKTTPKHPYTALIITCPLFIRIPNNS